MSKRFGLGFVIGYVVGARSGGQGYEQLADAGRKVLDLPGVRGLVSEGQERLREAAQRALDALREGGGGTSGGSREEDETDIDDETGNDIDDETDVDDESEDETEDETGADDTVTEGGVTVTGADDADDTVTDGEKKSADRGERPRGGGRSQHESGDGRRRPGREGVHRSQPKRASAGAREGGARRGSRSGGAGSRTGGAGPRSRNGGRDASRRDGRRGRSGGHDDRRQDASRRRGSKRSPFTEVASAALARGRTD